MERVEYERPPLRPLAADLLLLLWPVFFVTAARQDPHLRVRNFRKSATRGSERVASVSKTLCLPLAKGRRGALARRAGQRTTGETGEERPSWECADSSFCEQVMSAFVAVVDYSLVNIRLARALMH